MDDAFFAAMVNNPRVLREMPRLLRDAGLELADVLPYMYSEVGTGRFFAGAAESYAPMIRSSGLVAGETVDAWLHEQRCAVEQRTFFAACNYYAYLALRPSLGECAVEAVGLRQIRETFISQPFDVGWFTLP